MFTVYGLTFNWIDCALAGTVTLCLLFGIISGMVMQIASILSIAAGMLLSFFLGPLAAAALNRWIDSTMICGLLGHTGAFMIGSLIVRIIASYFSNIIKSFKLEKFDRIAGGVIGAVKGLIIAAVLIVIASRFQIEAIKEPLSQSVTAEPLIDLTDKVWGWAEEREFGQKIATFKRSLVEKAGLLKEKGEELAVEYGKKKVLKAEGGTTDEGVYGAEEE